MIIVVEAKQISKDLARVVPKEYVWRWEHEQAKLNQKKNAFWECKFIVFLRPNHLDQSGPKGVPGVVLGGVVYKKHWSQRCAGSRFGWGFVYLIISILFIFIGLGIINYNWLWGWLWLW